MASFLASFSLLAEFCACPCPPQFICGSLNPQYQNMTVLGDKVFKEVTKLSEAIRIGSTPIGLVSL